MVITIVICCRFVSIELASEYITKLKIPLCDRRCLGHGGVGYINMCVYKAFCVSIQ